MIGFNTVSDQNIYLDFQCYRYDFTIIVEIQTPNVLL